MARPKKITKMVRFALAEDAYNRFAVLGEAMGLDTASAVRVCASLQLAQLEATHISPNLKESSRQREARATKSAEELIPEMPRSKPERKQKEPEPEPMGFRPRSELDDQGDELQPVAAPLVRVDRPEWTGYMRGL
jgi:hypothetical protein